MCRTSFTTFYVLCGHSTIENNKCQAGNCIIEIPQQSLDNYHVCNRCSRGRSTRLPRRQRLANHQQISLRIAQEQAQYAAQLQLQAEILAENARILELEREEEIRLAEISPDAMTMAQSQRIRFLYDDLVENSRDEMAIMEIHGCRLRTLRRALFNIPAWLMEDWTVQQLTAHLEAFFEDINTRSEQLSEENDGIFEAWETLSVQARQDSMADITRGQRQVSRDLTNISAIKTLRDVRLNLNTLPLYCARSAKNLQHTKAISKLLEPIEIETLSKDEFSQRCGICMENFGDANEGEEAEKPSRLPCGHVYGTTCLTTWLMENSTCGFCRRNFWEELGAPPPPPIHNIAPADEEQSEHDLGLPDYVDAEEAEPPALNQSAESNDDDELENEHIIFNFPFFDSILPPRQGDQGEFMPLDSDLDYEELEPVPQDENPFMAWAMSSSEDLAINDQEFDEDEMMRFLNEDQGLGMEDQGESRPMIAKQNMQEDEVDAFLQQIDFEGLPPPSFRLE
ncbi:hypothetical protein BDZ45DRAFT_755974 [Acephala macrosclerotiorum]|nr:hypothetical protein BDZ45DRAFT_755974 [Acephala macrosclerotiorum]